MTTNTQIKTQVDLDITSKTTTASITPANVGNNIKTLVDYVDQETATVSLKENLSNKSSAITTETTDTKYPSIKAVKDYVDGSIGDAIADVTVDITALYTLKEDKSNKSNNIATDAASTVKYPSVKAIKDYADGLVIGLVDDRGNFTPSATSPGGYPLTSSGLGGSGVAGAIKKGDLWYVAANGFIGTTAVSVGTSVRALVDNPGSTATNWNILNVGLGYTSENQANKSIDVVTDAASDVKYPSVKAVKTYVDNRTGAVKTYGVISLTAGVTKPILPYDFNNVQKNNTSECVLPTTTEIGKEVIFFASSYVGTVTIYANEAGTPRLQGIFNGGISSASGSFAINANETYRFVSLASGYWYCEKIIDVSVPTFQLLSERTTDVTLATNSDFKYPTERAVKTYVDNKLGTVKTTDNILSNTNSAPFPYSDTDFTMFVSGNSFSLPISALGTVKYIRTTSTATLYASPNPGVGASINFLLPTGSGNSTIALASQKVYRFTFIGGFGNPSISYWVAEIMNTLS